jgi:hypothetical protein
MASNLAMLARVARGLGDLKDEVVFVGGSVAELYADDPAASDIRPTMDVDCVVELSTRKGYYELEEALRLRGFKNDITPGAPICRWIFEDIIVDVMPDDEAVLGFSNRWYGPGIEHRIKMTLPDGTWVYVFPVEYYLTAKFEAMLSRGGNDLRTSHDFEDIVYILDNCVGLVEQAMVSKDKSLRDYLGEQCAALLMTPNIEESIEVALPYGEGERRIVIMDIIKRIASED